MKKLRTIIIAMVLFLGMTQCKKQETPETPNTDGKWVHITMKVADGAKHIVYPNTGAVLYSEGDVIYVGNGGHYVGSLTYTDGVFSGDIQSPVTTDYLHFYFVGGCLPSTTPSEGNTTDFTVSIANQSSKLPVLSYGHSTQQYTNGTATYSCMLENKCGLVKFVPATETDKAVTVSGFYNMATIDFATPGITPTGVPGDITLFAESDAAKWAVLLPQTGVSATATISGYSCAIEGTFDITNNYHNSTGVSIAMTLVGHPAPTTASIDSYQSGAFSWDDKFPGDGDHSRTTLDPSTKAVSFSAGDKISIFSAQNTKKRFRTDSGGATATLTFDGTGTVENDAKFYAISPFRDDNLTLNGDVISRVCIPDQQYIFDWGSYDPVEPSWDPYAAVAYAVTEDESLQFHNLCAMLRIHVDGYWRGYMTISANEVMAGYYYLDTSNGALTPEWGYSTIQVGFPYDDACIIAMDRVLYIGIAPGTYSSFNVCAFEIIPYEDPSLVKQKTKSSVTFEAGKIYDLGDFYPD